MFTPSLPVTAYLSRIAGFNRFGETVRAPERAVQVAVIEFKNVALKSPIRTSQSATQGRAEEQEAIVTLLFAPNADVQIDDQVRVYGINLVVTGVWPREDLFGNVRHLRVSLTRMENG